MSVAGCGPRGGQGYGALVGEIATMTTFRTPRAIALAAALASVAAGPLAHAATAPPLGPPVAVQGAPEHAVPDAGDPGDSAYAADAGLEAREAMPSAPGVPAVQPGTLDAQYAVLKARGVSAPPAELVAMQQAPMAAQAQAAEAQPSEPQPSVALARRVVEAAQAFTGYMERAGALRPDYVDAAGVSRALRVGSVYEAGQLQEGAVAYVALAALQDPMFVGGVQRLGAAAPADAVGAALAADPRQVLRTPGAEAAAMRAAAALARYGYGLQSAGAAVKQSAYDIQHQPWSKGSIAAPQADLAEVKARSAVRVALAEDGGRALLASLGELRRGGSPDGTGRLTPTVARGLTLAALAVLGQAGEDRAERVAALMTEPTSAECLKMARLNLYQCLSVVGPEYEDVFCLGQHAMMETARCVAAASGWTPGTPAASPAVEAVAPAPERPTSIMVPVAMSVQGSEQASPPAPVGLRTVADAAMR